MSDAHYFVQDAPVGGGTAVADELRGHRFLRKTLNACAGGASAFGGADRLQPWVSSRRDLSLATVDSERGSLLCHELNILCCRGISERWDRATATSRSCSRLIP